MKVPSGMRSRGKIKRTRCGTFTSRLLTTQRKKTSNKGAYPFDQRTAAGFGGAEVEGEEKRQAYLGVQYILDGWG